jgi:methionyl-tRNA formyltransferase
MRRAIFMGTPEFALPSLQALHALTEVVAVVAQPDRPSGRGQRTLPPPVARLAQAEGLRLLQPARLREPEVIGALSELRPEVIVVAAYGKILPKSLLDLPAHGCVNVHASLLPRYRGAAPIQWAIARGEKVTGISLMRMDEGLDTGPVYVQESLSIDGEDTGGLLTVKLADLGGSMLDRFLPAILDGKLPATAQDPTQATLAPKLTRADAVLDFRLAATELEARVRAFQPWPGAVALLPGGARLKVLRATVLARTTGSPGTVLQAGSIGLVIASGEGALQLDTVQPEGRRAMTAGEFLAGHRLIPGTSLGIDG